MFCTIEILAKEEIMAVKIMIKRTFKEGTRKEASAMLIKSRAIAIEQSGYIASETLVSYDDPNTILVMSMWQTKEDWDNYKKSAARKDNERNYARIMDGVTAYEIYKIGI
jgi:heme-degrading monooxygenase HmoA